MSKRVNKKSEDGPIEESPVESAVQTPDGEGRVERGVEAAELPSPGGWWGSWISAAKDKSVEVLGMVKKDLDELSTAVKSEASHVINTTSSAIGKTLRLDEPESTANTMKKSFSTFMDQVNTVLNPSPDDDDTEVYIITDGEPVALTSLQKEVLALQRLDATYLVPPEGEALSRLAAWRAVHSRAPPAALQRLLLASPVLQEKFTRLVPAALPADDFWERYLFRKALLEDRLSNLNSALAYQPSDTVVSSVLELPSSPSPAPALSAAPSPSDSVRSNCGSSPQLSEGQDSNVQWDNDFAMDVELSEEQQTKLLEEYEEEIRTAKQSTLPSKQAVSPSPTKSVSSPQLNQSTSDKSPKKSLSQSKITPLKKTADSKSKSSDTVANVQKTMAKKLTQGNKKPPSKNAKSDIQSKLVEDHFVDDHPRKAKVKSLSEELAEKAAVVDNASSNSDESWEKEFEFEDGKEI